MASRSVSEKWLVELAGLPTASGREDAVQNWVRAWVKRRPDLRLSEDSGGNLLITIKGRRRRDPVLAVAHMDHPGFVVTEVSGNRARFEFRGGVLPAYFANARVEFATGSGRGGTVVEYDQATRTGMIELARPYPEPGDIARWRFGRRRIPPGHLAAPAFDDLAGCAAGLAALDRARQRPDLTHFGVLLTRAEELGFVGAIHAALSGGVPDDARILSIETSRASADSPVGAGPVIRVGDGSSVFDAEMTNRITTAVRESGLAHQRKLMSGGSCEATAFAAYGFRASGLCLPLGNYHNMGNLDQVERGSGSAVPMLEEISVEDFHGLVDLLLVAAGAVDRDWGLRERLDQIYADGRPVLG